MILGIGDATTAAIVGPVVVATVTGFIGAVKLGLKIRDELQALRSETAHRIGTPNGHGNVVEMNEKLLAGQAGQDNRIARLEGDMSAVREDVRVLMDHRDTVDESIKTQGQRIGTVAQEVAVLKGAPCLASTTQEDDR